MTTICFDICPHCPCPQVTKLQLSQNQNREGLLLGENQFLSKKSRWFGGSEFRALEGVPLPATLPDPNRGWRRQREIGQDTETDDCRKPSRIVFLQKWLQVPGLSAPGQWGGCEAPLFPTWAGLLCLRWDRQSGALMVPWWSLSSWTSRLHSQATKGKMSVLEVIIGFLL